MLWGIEIWGIFALQVPNGFGCGLGALQLILYFIYRRPGAAPDEKPTNNDGLNMEMSLHKAQLDKPQATAKVDRDDQV